MRRLKFVYLLLGMALLGVIIAQTDLAEVARRVAQMGWGMAIVIGLYFVTFGIDSLTWQVTLTGAPLNLRWLGRMWKVRLVGEAFNMTVPAGGMGGEPVKAVLLKTHYDVDYRDGVASMFLAKTANMIGLALFLASGFALMLGHGAIPDGYKAAAGIGLAGFAAATVIFFSIQRLKLSSSAAARLSRWRLGRWLAGGMEHIHEVESRFVEFYGGRKARFAAVVALAVASWVIGVFETYYALTFLGGEVTIMDAWVIEAMAQMMRMGSFFIPASIGVQDGAFVLMCAAITGSPSLGVAVALVRRLREIIWVGAGFTLASVFSMKPADR